MSEAPRESTLAWHFVSADRKLRDGNSVAPGYVYAVDPDELSLCQWGLHASVRPLDALRYAPGPIICRVECRGRVLHDTDKLVCSEREVLWMADATDALRGFARQCAQDVLHLWNPPDVQNARLESALRARNPERDEYRSHAVDDPGASGRDEGAS